MNSYNFQITIKQYERSSPTLHDMRVVRATGICIVAKNSKFGGLYLHPKAKIVKGRFEHVAGSNSYPILYPKSKEVVIEVTDFERFPEITTDRYAQHSDIVKLKLLDNKPKTH